MKIALIGYGKMGKEIDSLSGNLGHEIVLRINEENAGDLTKENLSKADVAIEFTRPDGAVGNLSACFAASIPVVTGTTGWYNQLPKVKDLCEKHQGALLYASNFSVGVQVFFHINKILASILKKLPEYDVNIEETHHLEKLDKPSGTALSLAQIIMQNLERKNQWSLEEPQKKSQMNDLIIKAYRKENVIGTHIVNYESAIDTISLKHEAKSRKGFAYGAMATASWLKDKKGVFTMDDYMNDVFYSARG